MWPQYLFVPNANFLLHSSSYQNFSNQRTHFYHPWTVCGTKRTPPTLPSNCITILFSFIPTPPSPPYIFRSYNRKDPDIVPVLIYTAVYGLTFYTAVQCTGCNFWSFMILIMCPGTFELPIAFKAKKNLINTLFKQIKW